MAISDRFTGTDLVVHFLPTGGTVGADEIVLSGSFTSFSFDWNTDTADVTAGNEKTRSFIPTIEALTWQLSMMDEGAYANYVEVAPRSTGLLTVYPKGTGASKPYFSFNSIIESYNNSYPFDDKVEIEISGMRNGAMVAPLGSTTPAS